MAANHQETAIDTHAPHLDLDALIVGAGFGGSYLLKLLRDQGLRVKVFEAGKGAGGVWWWNRYPGARVDSEVPYYGYSDPAIWNSFHWSERFPGDAELRKYFAHVDNVWQLSKDIAFNTTVVEAVWNEKDASWLVKTGNGRSCRCTWFIAATGTSFRPHTPKWDGYDKFTGEMHHSSLWPVKGVDMKDKRVAVIGAGASGIQIVQDAVKEASHVTQFIRTPNIAIPMRQRKLSDDETYQYKNVIPHVFRACRETRTGLPILGKNRGTFDDSPEEREAHWEEQWRRGGFNFAVGGYADQMLNKEANLAAYEFWKKKTRSRISDPVKRDLLAPEVPPYWMGTKRPSLEQDYYVMIDKPHVEITNATILGFNEKGILTKGRVHEFDVIAVATGYDAVTGGLRTMGIRGKDGLELQEKWKDGVYTHLGMTVHGFPNMYMIYGPQAPTSLTNGPPFIEMQCEWISDAIAKLRDQQLRSMEPKKEAEDQWRKTCIDISNMTLAVETDSWWMGGNIPGKRKEMLLYMGGIPPWNDACQNALADWKDFDVKAAA